MPSESYEWVLRFPLSTAGSIAPMGASRYSVGLSTSMRLNTSLPPYASEQSCAGLIR